MSSVITITIMECMAAFNLFATVIILRIHYNESDSTVWSILGGVCKLGHKSGKMMSKEEKFMNGTMEAIEVEDSTKKWQKLASNVNILAFSFSAATSIISAIVLCHLTFN